MYNFVPSFSNFNKFGFSNPAPSKCKIGVSKHLTFSPLRATTTAKMTIPNDVTKLSGKSGENRPSANCITTMEEFWNLADESQTIANYDADSSIAFLREASLEEIRRICIQYRYFIEIYPNHLALLLSKMPNVQLKSLLCAILSEEMGYGKISNAHIVMYDKFLRSIGISEEQMQDSLYIENQKILSEIEYRCNTKPFENLVGMVGMAGECLCQIYLTSMYKHLVHNKNVQLLGKQIDWEFWKFHVGEEDIKHRKLVRECINELVFGEDGVKELANGYIFGKTNWDKFWFNNFKNTGARLN